MSAALPFIRPTVLKLYGVNVLAKDFSRIKKIADELVGCTTTREYTQEARTRCAKIALSAVVEATVGFQRVHFGNRCGVPERIEAARFAEIVREITGRSE